MSQAYKATNPSPERGFFFLETKGYILKMNTFVSKGANFTSKIARVSIGKTLILRKYNKNLFLNFFRVFLVLWAFLRYNLFMVAKNAISGEFRPIR